MKPYLYIILLAAISSFILSACQPVNSKTNSITSITSNTSYTSPKMSEDFKKYWYEGNAEIASYKLEQARYGQIREGHATLIFVTEDFSKEKQVKLDFAQQAGEDRLPILKLNFVKKFNTGIYPYSLMQSIFSPVDLQTYPHLVKTTMSVQEWCGHVFTQVNLGQNAYSVQGFSYFESEGDESYKLDVQWLEDEIWTRIRIAPEDLPTGEFEIIPALFYSRLTHKEIKPLKATGKLSQSEDNDQAMEYTLEYPQLDRRLVIHYQKNFPHKILAWEEIYKDGYGPNAKSLTTKATLKEIKKIAYWSKNSNSDEYLRTELGLP